MSRLDSFIRRLHAQKACLDCAVPLIAAVEGPILEIGLGNGRTYDHLRELFRDREIFVFERRVAAHPDCIPDPEHLILGDIHETLPTAEQRIRASAALAHVDCGTGDSQHNKELAAAITDGIERLMRPGGIIVSDQAMPHPTFVDVALPGSVADGRYFMYRRV